MATNPSFKPTEEPRLSDASSTYQRNYDNSNERSGISRPSRVSSTMPENSALGWLLVAIVIVMAVIIGYSWYKNIGGNIAPNPEINNARALNTSATGPANQSTPTANQNGNPTSQNGAD